jgi:hypothetical protein
LIPPIPIIFIALLVKNQILMPVKNPDVSTGILCYILNLPEMQRFKKSKTTLENQLTAIFLTASILNINPAFFGWVSIS